MYPAKLNELQIEIMTYIIDWGAIHKKPIPIRIVIDEMKSKDVTESRTVRAFRGLVKKNYLRRSNDRCSRSSYVRLKGI